MKRILAIALALSVGLNVGFLVRELREEPPRGPKPPRGESRRPSFERIFERHVERVQRELELDDAQVSALRDVHGTMLPQILEAEAWVEELRDEAAHAFTNVDQSPAEFRALVREVQASRARLDSLLTEVLLGEVAALEPEQRERYIRTNPWGRRLDGRPKGDRPSRKPPEGDRRSGDGPPRPR